MLQKITLILLITFGLNLSASYEEGKALFQDKCSSCHGEFISISDLKVNFFEKNNEILKLDSPTENMIVYAIMDSSKKIGDPEDPEMRQIEIEDYLKSILKNPNINDSICEPTIMKHYKKKEPMIISDEEATLLTNFIIKYNEEIEKTHPKKVKILSSNYDEKEILDRAKKLNKKIIVYATSKNCVFCKKMKKEVLDLEEIQSLQDKDYIFLEVDVDYIKLPFGVTKYYQQITPTFFFLDNNGKFQNAYPGSWNKSDYIEILKENL